jgi:LysR family transcriptional regulator, hypochlorite-specific transcription factor HypT
VDIRWLQDFLSLAETGNFTSAADARHSSQPAFSRRIQSLEAWLGVELIDRSRYPTVLTPAGERFRAHAADLVRKMIDSRSDLQGEPVAGSGSIAFALPHTLAISRFPSWWKEWQPATGHASCRLLASNVHDSVTAFVAGLTDMLICFHHAQQPITLDNVHYDRIAIGTEWLRPYSAARRGQPLFKLEGAAKAPVPLLNYSAGAFLGRMVDIIHQSAPQKLHAEPAFESDLADALLGMAVAGHGVAWLPECTAAAAVAAGHIKLAGDDLWSLPLSVFIYRDRAHATTTVNKLMGHLESRALREAANDRSVTQLAGSARRTLGETHP